MAEPRVFAAAPGVDFPQAVAGRLFDLADGDPVRLSSITLISNSARMQNRIRGDLIERGPVLLPRSLLVTEIDRLLPPGSLPATTPPLKRRLELAHLVQRLIESDPTLAPKSSIYDLADSLARLLDELQGEGVASDALSDLDVQDESGHWQRSVSFLSIVQRFLEQSDAETCDAEARRGMALDQLEATWTQEPPKHPIVIAGSTGSRGTTARLMQIVARLPNGQILLPGVDTSLTDPVFQGLAEGRYTEDHPQARLADVLAKLDLGPSDVGSFGPPPPDPQRNALVSLSLRPAPVTDQWLREGPSLGDLRQATQSMTLVEASSPKEEAQAIALVLRDAAAEGRKVAVISPDRMLMRRVEAALARWGITPDDSAGKPLPLSPPGRLLRQLASVMGHQTSPADLISLLSHPLTATGGERGPHLLKTRELELALRRKRHPFVTVDVLKGLKDQPDTDWLIWVADLVAQIGVVTASTLDACLQSLIDLAENLAGGASGQRPGDLWKEAPGRAASEAMADLVREATDAQPITLADFRTLLDYVLGTRNVRTVDPSHPSVMIWGTLEGRVQGADLVVLSGLNEGVWPAAAGPDPWLNRKLRKQAGLLLPERTIGLSAHDFQQAVAAPEVILTRARRDTEAETVPSRWLNRLTNLLSGLPEQNGDAALTQMRARGQIWLEQALALDRPEGRVEPASRPAPAPPVEARPKKLSLSDLETLIRDPYAIYAKRVLDLRALDDLTPRPDAAVRGSALHLVMEKFVLALKDGSADLSTESLVHTAQDVLSEVVPWPAMAQAWTARLARIAPALIEREKVRWQNRASGAVEVWGGLDIEAIGVHIFGKADRIDLGHDGRLTIFDYKSGGPKPVRQVAFFDPQLPVEAVMAEAGGFKDIAAAPVAAISHIGLGGKADASLIPMEDGKEHDFRTATVLAGLTRLLARYQNPAQGFLARRAMEKVRFEGDYDHLARAGEWDDTDPAATEVFRP